MRRFTASSEVTKFDGIGKLPKSAVTSGSDLSFLGSIRKNWVPNMYLTDKQVANRFNVTRHTIWRWHREMPAFPRAIILSPGCTRWKLSEIEGWEADAKVAD